MNRYDFFSEKELKSIKENDTVVEMYNKHKKHEISDSEYQLFVIALLGNYIKGVINRNHFNSIGDYEDCMQAAIMAVIEKLPMFDPNMGSATTYFTPVIMSSLTKSVTDPDGSKYYHGVWADLNRTAQKSGFSGVDDPNLTVHMLHAIAYSKYTVPTIVHTIEYMHNNAVCSLEAVSDNIDVESTYENPETVQLKKERSEALKQILDKKLTSFEKWLFVEVANNLGGQSFRPYLAKIKDAEFRAQFTDDEVFTKEKFDGNYLQKRYNRIIERLRNNAVLQAYGTPRERAVTGIIEYEQASDDDISNAFNDGDLFDDEEM